MNNNITLSLGESYSDSKLTKQVYENELNEINIKYPLRENQVDIRATYFLKNHNDLEVGFFIRNGLNKNASFENILLTVQNSENIEIIVKEFNFKRNGRIPPHSARPFVVKFSISEEIDLEGLEGYSIKFSEVNNLNAFSSISTEIENIPINLPFDEEKAIKDFAFKLKTLKAEEFDISLYKLSYIDNSVLQCTLLFRNGANKEAKVEKLPISLLNENEELFARKVFSNEKGLIKIGARQSKLMTFEFTPSDITSKKFDISKCKVIYK